MLSIRWRIYYGDGSTFDSSMGEPEDAPGYDTQIIVGYERNAGRIVYYLWDWYYYRVYPDGWGEWYGCDLHGLLDIQLHFPKEIKCIKMGRSVRNEVFDEIKRKAFDDPDIPNTNEVPLEFHPKQCYGQGFKNNIQSDRADGRVA